MNEESVWENSHSLRARALNREYLKPANIILFLSCLAFFSMPLGTSPFSIAGACLLLAWICTGEFIKRKKDYVRIHWFWPVLLMIVIYWAGLLYTPDVRGLGLKYAGKSHYWLYALAMVSLFYTTYPLENVVKAFFIGLFINALAGLLQFIHIVPIISGYETVCTGFNGGYNTLAILLIIGIMTASFYFRKAGEKKTKTLYASLMLVYFLHLIILQGRTGYLTFIILSPLVVYNIVYNLLPQKGILLIPLLCLILIGSMFLSPVFRERFRETIKAARTQLNAGEEYASGKKYLPDLDRIYMWRWAVHLFLKHPVLGVGTGGYKKAMVMEGADWGIDHPHNNILYIMASYGTTGLLIFIWLFWALLKKGWSYRNTVVGYFTLASCLAFLIGGLADSHILDAGGSFLLALTAGLQIPLTANKPIIEKTALPKS